ncbi:uncharacterized protein LOC134250254 [Saccostrea cucullata]|uniref:uncharacterized protein LOC134250254 n=1 Tax=Saccostrea cuccullata TaxID=36930 RepID=UPI002ED415DD
MTGHKIRDFSKDNQGEDLYEFPDDITENKNGDVWTSDRIMVVVVEKSGEHRFDYEGQQSQSNFSPRGICSDILGNVLVCDYDSSNASVHLLDQDGQLLSLILTNHHNIHDPMALSVDDENNLYLGQLNSNIITVFKYLQITEK